MQYEKMLHVTETDHVRIMNKYNLRLVKKTVYVPIDVHAMGRVALELVNPKSLKSRYATQA